MSGDEEFDPPLFKNIAEAEKRLARAEQDLEDVRLERNTVEGRATDYGRMSATPRGEWLIDEVNRRSTTALDIYRQARAELNDLLAELETWNVSYREPHFFPGS